MSEKEKLFGQFPPVTTEAWMEMIRSDLKGADFSKKLIWKSREDFDILPFYREENIADLPFINSLPGEYPYLRGNRTDGNDWLIRQDIEVTDYNASNKKALFVLERGISSLGFIISDPGTISTENFRILLQDIYLDAIEVNFFSNGKAAEILDILKGIASERGIRPESLKGAIEADPLGRLAMNGDICIPVEDGFDYLASLTRNAASFPNFKTLHINAALFADAGSTVSGELALALSMGAEYLDKLTARGIDAGTAASSMRFSFSTGPEYFPELAKLRAARLLWSLLLNGYNVSDTGMTIHSSSAQWNMTIYDPYVNMLRTQTEAMAAILGGADSVTVTPFDKPWKKSDEFSERIARNQQLILREEAYFDKVADPAAGSYYVENLTYLMARKAWELFINIEKEGGFLKAFHSGFIQKMVQNLANERRKEYSLRKSVLVGTSKYPDNNESISGSLKQTVKLLPEYDPDCGVGKIVPFRVSTEFEKIRLAVDKAPVRPSVFLMPVGNVLLRNARAQFSAGFFGCAGYRIIDNAGFETIDDGISAALSSGADIVVICTGDEEYLSIAKPVWKSLGGLKTLVIAGNPVSADDLREIGFSHFIHLKSDAVETLRHFNEIMGIKTGL